MRRPGGATVYEFIFLNPERIFQQHKKASFSFLDQLVAVKVLTASISEDLASPLRLEWEIKYPQ